MDDMTIKRRGLMRAICEDPFDDVPRLILADLLEESGEDAHAEFIRAQIKAWSGVGSLDRPTLNALWLRACELLTAERVQPWFSVPWMSGFDVTVRALDVEFYNRRDTTVTMCTRRGFIDRVRCRITYWLKYGRAIVKNQPVTQVDITDQRPDTRGGGKPSWYIQRSGERVRWGGYWHHLLPCEFRPHFPSIDAISQRQYFDSPEEAMCALSNACVNWARRKAKLPDLVWPS